MSVSLVRLTNDLILTSFHYYFTVPSSVPSSVFLICKTMTYKNGLILLWVTTILAFSQQDQIEILPSDKVMVDSNDNVALTCIYKRNCSAKWLKDKQILINLKDCTQTKKQKLENDRKTYCLNEVQERYGGKYTCETTCENVLAQKTAILIVKGKSSPKVCPINKSQNVTVNTNARFYFNLTGSPMPNVSCILNNKKVLFCTSDKMKDVMYRDPSRSCMSADQRYQIRSDVVQTPKVVFEVINVTFTKDSGTIFCNLKNKHGEQTNFSMKIAVTERISPTHSTTTPLTVTDNNYIKIIWIGAGCALLLLLVLAVGLVLYCRVHKLKNQYEIYLKSNGVVDPSKFLNEQMHDLSYDKDWEFPVNLLEISGDFLGRGNFGNVYEGKAYGIALLNPRDKSCQARNRRKKLRRSTTKKVIENKNEAQLATRVAIKTVKDEASNEEIRDFAGELKLMMHIREHKNIVNLLGVCYKESKLHGILEFCPYGNLREFLQSKRNLYEPTWVKTNYDEDEVLTLANQVTIAQNICEGMQFLASQKCVHRDLAARNILLGENYIVKVADFGIARNINQDYKYISSRSRMLPIKWMALESLVDLVYTEKSDVWSFGILLWEIMTLGGFPYPEISTYEELVSFLSAVKRMEKPDRCSPELYAIMLDCWQEKPEARPSFEDLSQCFKNLLIMKTSSADLVEGDSVSNSVDDYLLSEYLDHQSRTSEGSYVQVKEKETSL